MGVQQGRKGHRLSASPLPPTPGQTKWHYIFDVVLRAGKETAEEWVPTIVFSGLAGIAGYVLAKWSKELAEEFVESVEQSSRFIKAVKSQEIK